MKNQFHFRLVFPAVMLSLSFAANGCSGSGSAGNDAGGSHGSGGKAGSGGVTSSGGNTATTDGSGGAGGVTGSGGKTASGGSGSAGGVTGSGGRTASGGSGGGGGATGSGGRTASGGSGGAAGSGAVTGGQTSTGGGLGGGPGSGGRTGTGGGTGAGGQTGVGGSTGGGGAGPGCSAVEAAYLDPVPPRPFKVSSPLWKARLKKQLTVWLPHVIDKLSDVNVAEGGIQNFVEAGKKLAGQSAKAHVPQSAPWSNGYVMNAVEAMSEALMVDSEGDSEITAAQAKFKSKLEDWIPKILSAQEKDGYLQTYLTLGGLPHFNGNRGLHEGYVGGYFLEAAIAHYLMSNRTDRRLYDAAKKLADLWESTLGPSPKKSWWESHQEMEQALTRFARFVSAEEGAGAGDKYIRLAKFLLDVRGTGGGGGVYDLSDKPPLQHSYRVQGKRTGTDQVSMDARDPFRRKK